MRSVVAGVVAVVALLGCAVSSGVAQSPSSGWQLAPRAGVFFPTASLGDVPVLTGIEGASLSVPTREAKLSAGAAVGISFLRELAAGSSRLRLDVDYVPPVDVEVSGSNLPVQASVASAVVGIEKALTRPGLFQPYVAFGAGLRAYHFQPWMSAGPQFPDQQLSPAVRVGGGVVLRVLVASVAAEVTDQVSSFRFEDGGDRRMQNDLHGLVSVRLRLF